MEMEMMSCAQLKSVVTRKDALEAARVAFTREVVQQPDVVQLLFPNRDGEVCIKAAQLADSKVYVMKMASGFQANSAQGLPTGSGMMIVGCAITGKVLAVLMDDGWLTDLRTAAAGALAVQELAVAKPKLNVAVLGSGVQAKMQFEALMDVRKVGRVRVWSRTSENAAKYVRWVLHRVGVSDVSVSGTPAEAVTGADVILCCTSAHTALISARDLSPGVTVIAIGADTPGKQEVHEDVFAACVASGGKIVCDKIEQCSRLGDLQHCTAADIEQAVELSSVMNRSVSGRESDDAMIIVDLTGMGAQDAAIAEFAYDRIVNK